MNFGKGGIFYRFILNHLIQTFSLAYILRLIATLIGSYRRSQKEAQRRAASTGGHVLRRIYGHIVAQGFGAEKLTASLDSSTFPHRRLGTFGQIGMASVIVLVAWVYWPGEAGAPALSSASELPVSAQLIPLSSVDSGVTGSVVSAGQSPAEVASLEQIELTKERFAALSSPAAPAEKNETEARAPFEATGFGPEIEDGPIVGDASKGTDLNEPAVVQTLDVATLDEPAGPSRPGGLSNLLTSLAEIAVIPREKVEKIVADVSALAGGEDSTGQITVEVQPTSTPLPLPTPGPVPVLVPGPEWPDFTPAAAPAVDHFWLEQPHPTGYNQLYSPNYQFGSTANERYRIHHGVDIAGDTGIPVLAMGEGEVVHAGPDNPTLLGPYNNFYGNSVVIRLNRRLATLEGEQDVYVLLGHMSEVYVERGQQVTPDVVVGAVGMTGIAIGPHLHVEVRVGQNSYLDSVNPALWMRNPSGTGSVAVRLLTADGRSWSDARLSLLRYEGGGTRWVRTIEIYPDAENIGADPSWGENGALSQLAAGAYWLGGVVNGEKFGQNITIYPGETTFVEMRTQQ